LGCTESAGNEAVGHGIERHEKARAVSKRDDGRVPRIAQVRKAMGLVLLSAADLTVMRRLIENERDRRIAQQAPRTFRKRGSLGQIVHR
jgi:hypothetical protein